MKLEAHGGFYSDTIADLVEAGADTFFSSSGIFQDSDYIKKVNAQKAACHPAGIDKRAFLALIRILPSLFGGEGDKNAGP